MATIDPEDLRRAVAEELARRADTAQAAINAHFLCNDGQTYHVLEYRRTDDGAYYYCIKCAYQALKEERKRATDRSRPALLKGRQ